MRGTIEIKKIGITDLDTDAIVNAANGDLAEGSGVCGAIFKAAGAEEMRRACAVYGHCATGGAVITKGFRLKAKFVIHAVGPVWHGGCQGEPQALRSAYKRSLELAADRRCASIGFPLISAGVYGYPLDKAWNEALTACGEYLDENPDCGMKIVFAVIDDGVLAQGEKALAQTGADKYKPEKDKFRGLFDIFIKADAKPDRLRIDGRELEAVFFHMPEEPNGYLSNWYRASFELDGIKFNSAEQFIMYTKCMTFGDTESASAVLATDDPAEQQRIGRSTKNYLGTVWNGMRQVAAYRGLVAKFEQNEDLREKLLSTGDAVLVECSGSDRVWACGIRFNDDRRRDASQWPGKNILGFALMRVREDLKARG